MSKFPYCCSLILLCALLHLGTGCGPTLKHSDTFTPKKVKAFRFEDQCKLQTYFDHNPPELFIQSESVQEGKGVSSGRVTYLIKTDAEVKTFIRLLQTFYKRLPTLDYVGPLRVEVTYIKNADKNGEQAQIPIDAETRLELHGEAVALPYHPCMDAFFFGRSYYAMRRKLLGLPEPVLVKTVPDLIKDLYDSKAEVRSQAITALGEKGNKASVALAQELLKLTAGGVNMAVIEALIETKGHALAVVPQLFEALKIENDQIRLKASLALVKLYPQIKEIKKNAPFPVLEHISRYLALMNYASPIPILLHAAKKQPEEFRIQVHRAVGKLGSEVIAQLKKLLKEPDEDLHDQVVGALMEVGVEALPILVTVFKSKKFKKREPLLAQFLSRLPVSAISQIIPLLDDKDSFIRLQAVTAIGQLAAQAKPVKKSLIESPNAKGAGVQTTVTKEMLKDGFAPSSAIPALVQLLDDKEEKIQEKTRWALAEIGTEAIPSLIEALKNKDFAVQCQAALTLGKMGKKAKKAIPLLKKKLHIRDKKIRQIFATAYADISGDTE